MRYQHKLLIKKHGEYNRGRDIEEGLGKTGLFHVNALLIKIDEVKTV